MSGNREGGGVEHPTGLDERLGIILPFRSRLSLISPVSRAFLSPDIGSILLFLPFFPESLQGPI